MFRVGDDTINWPKHSLHSIEQKKRETMNRRTDTMNENDDSSVALSDERMLMFNAFNPIDALPAARLTGGGGDDDDDLGGRGEATSTGIPHNTVAQNDAVDQQEKKMQRVMANRRSAKESRQRRRQLLAKLSATVDELSADNFSLKRTNLALRAEARELRQELNRVIRGNLVSAACPRRQLGQYQQLSRQQPSTANAFPAVGGAASVMELSFHDRGQRLQESPNSGRQHGPEEPFQLQDQHGFNSPWRGATNMRNTPSWRYHGI